MPSLDSLKLKLRRARVSRKALCLRAIGQHNAMFLQDLGRASITIHKAWLQTAEKFEIQSMFHSLLYCELSTSDIDDCFQ